MGIGVQGFGDRGSGIRDLGIGVQGLGFRGVGGGLREFRVCRAAFRLFAPNAILCRVVVAMLRWRPAPAAVSAVVILGRLLYCCFCRR